MKEIDSLNFVKLDILGLANIEIINNTCKLAGIPIIKADAIDYNDEAVWKDIMKDPLGIFQFSGRYAHDYLKEYSKKKLSLR